jgi:hypothetical protein
MMVDGSSKWRLISLALITPRCPSGTILNSNAYDFASFAAFNQRSCVDVCMYGTCFIKVRRYYCHFNRSCMHHVSNTPRSMLAFFCLTSGPIGHSNGIRFGWRNVLGWRDARWTRGRRPKLSMRKPETGNQKPEKKPSRS